MFATGRRRYRTMKLKSTPFLIIALVIAISQESGATEDEDTDDLLAIESKNRAVTIVESPKAVSTPTPGPLTTKAEVQTPKPEHRPPNKPPIFPDKPTKHNIFVDLPHPYYGSIHSLPPQRTYSKPLNFHSNSVYQFPRVIPLSQHHKSHYYIKQPVRPLQYVASTYSPVVTKSPKFTLPVQTINGIRTEHVRPPKITNTTTTTTTTTTETTTTAKILRTKRIWPKKVAVNRTATLNNSTIFYGNKTKTSSNSTNVNDIETSASHHKVRYVNKHVTPATTAVPPTKRYRPVTRTSKRKYSTASSANFTKIAPNDWVPIVPSHYPKHNKIVKASRRSDTVPARQKPSKNVMYLQSFGLLPIKREVNPTVPTMARKRMAYVKRRPQLNPNYSGYSARTTQSPVVYGDLQTEESQQPKVITKIKHHHHHHHHRYIKTVEKKVPYAVEVPKPFPVAVETKVPVPVEKVTVVEKRVPYPVAVEKKVPFPIGIKVPHPVPVKVVEKEYVPKPYPVVHHVPVLKHVQVKVPHPVPVAVEKKVPYPVEVQVAVPVDRPVPVPVAVEKRVPYPVPVKVLVPQPYPVEKKVPYTVKVKEPVEVIKHVPVRVPYPQPFAVKVPHPVPVQVEKRVPYPVEVEKKVPVPYEVFVPQRVEVEKKVPVYVPKPYPVEKRVPYPVKVPVPVQVPVPVEVPVYVHSPYAVHQDMRQYHDQYQASPSDESQQLVTVGTALTIESRSDDAETTTTPNPS